MNDNNAHGGVPLIESEDHSTTAELRKLSRGRHHDPFALLGRHPLPGETLVRLLLPDAVEARFEGGAALRRRDDGPLFEWRGNADALPAHYRIEWLDAQGASHLMMDPYSFGPQIPAYDLDLFSQGRHWHAQRFLGANSWRADGTAGILFAVWAPNAEGISVIGDFNRWNELAHPLRVRGGNGVWELFVPGLGHGALYKFALRSRLHGASLLKTDPYGREFELRPNTAARVVAPDPYPWSDNAWLARRSAFDWQHEPVSIYEVHLGSWRRDQDGRLLGYRELARQLPAYVRELGFTHIELLPVTEHPLDESWGYQTTGYFAPTSRFGSPDDFRYFIDCCHTAGIGVLLDWVPGHFPRDHHALARFDGTALYEHEDPRRGEQPDWGTLVYNYGRNEVRAFLISSAMSWIEDFHLDGLRVDAVASMLYLDYSRSEDDWLPNRYGGKENLEAIEFLRELNGVLQGQHPGVVVIAEESTAWPQVSRPSWLGGLGFAMKWNMGWMHDTLDYFAHDPIHRHYHHDHLTFGMLYAFSENFVLPFSHDEVVHGKRSLLHRMPGDEWQRFANVRLLYTYLFSYSGKKLLFMGGEFAQGDEWTPHRQLDWAVLRYPLHRGVQRLVTDLNHLYRGYPALHRHDFAAEGFAWIDCHDAAQSVVSYRRQGNGETLLVVLNFTPVVRCQYRLGVPRPGFYQELLNSDSAFYGGTDTGNAGGLHTEPFPWMGHAHSLALTLPPLSGLILRAPTDN